MSGRVVVVTGSTSGIGTGIALAFAVDGDRVVVHGRSAERGRAVLERLRAAAPAADVRLVLGDLADPAACQALIEESALEGRIDVLVNNAGTNVFTGVMETSLDDWQACIDLDLRAVWLCSRAAAERMPPGASIVNVASNHAFATLPGSFPYNVAKAGVVALTQSLAIDLAPRGIRANVVCPGYVDTPLNDRYFGALPDPEAARRRVERLHPVGRIGSVDEIAATVRFLASREAAFINGTAILADGGRAALMEDPG